MSDAWVCDVIDALAVLIARAACVTWRTSVRACVCALCATTGARMSERRAMEAAHIATAASTSDALEWEPPCFIGPVRNTDKILKLHDVERARREFTPLRAFSS